MKRVLVACEFSQVVMREFYERGCDAFSCDVIDTIGPYPDRHLKCDVRDVLGWNWDLIIAHPPCTYLSNAGQFLMRRNPYRFFEMDFAREFFYMFYNLPGKVCIENPRPMRRAGLPDPTFIVQPFMFGDPWSKETYLWLKNLPPFLPTDIVNPEYSLCFRYHDSRRRSIFSPGIAKAMAENWIDLL